MKYWARMRKLKFGGILLFLVLCLTSCTAKDRKIEIVEQTYIQKALLVQENNETFNGTTNGELLKAYMEKKQGLDQCNQKLFHIEETTSKNQELYNKINKK